MPPHAAQHEAPSGTSVPVGAAVSPSRGPAARSRNSPGRGPYSGGGPGGSIPDDPGVHEEQARDAGAKAMHNESRNVDFGEKHLRGPSRSQRLGNEAKGPYKRPSYP